jgi:putative oxidoreductase
MATNIVNRPRLVLPALGSVYASLEPLTSPLVRIVTGLLLLPHGAQKLFGAFGGGGIGGTAQFLDSTGFTPGWLWALAIALTEFVGGLCLVVGFLTRPAAIAVLLFMANAVLFHLGNGFFWSNGGFEYPAMWAVLALAIAIRGGGALSVDRALGREL